MIQQSIKTMTGGTTTKEKVKMALGLLFGLAADAAISAALGGLMPAGKGWKHLMRVGGTFILGMMVGEHVEEYVRKVFDDTDEAIQEAKKEFTEVANDIPEGTVK